MRHLRLGTIVLLGVCLMAGRASAQKVRAGSEMFAGTKVIEKDYQFIVKLIRGQPSGDLVCGGVAIDAHWVLTSAHCVRKNAAVPADRVVPAGAGVGSQTDVHPFRAFCHPKFKPGGDTVNDLALLLVDGKPLKPFAGKISAERALQANEAYFALGWGKPTPGVLQRSQPMTAAPDPDCQKLYTGQIMEPNEICAGSKDSAPCRFDSGGPLFTATKLLDVWSSERELMGVVSKADDDCKAVGPAIFAGFGADELKWIRNVMSTNSSTNKTPRADGLKACRQ